MKWLVFALRLWAILEPARTSEPDPELGKEPAATGAMWRLYERYSKEPRRPREANTARSFTAVRGIFQGKEILQFNLSSVQDSEVILSASFHFFNKRQHRRRPGRLSVAVRQRPPGPRILFLFHGMSPDSFSTRPLGNITVSSSKEGAWQSRDVTTAITQAGGGVITVESHSLQRGGLRRRENLFEDKTPFLILYADDRAVDRPNGVVATLQRYGAFPAGRDLPASTSRTRRELRFQIQTNEIPEVQLDTLKNHQLWRSTYFPAKSQSSTGKTPGQELLDFDERTMKKARRRQWSPPRVCARRYLKVDFADIGWSEWVLAPKSFDAYYCAGSCGFPIPKVVRSSNHATIQSIVRAVGIVPGVPEACCVPEKLSALAVLFLDPEKNLVLKVYPGMSVDTCTCL
ncbi:growth/differentiation factor 10 [Stigmatopora argus]